MTIPRARLEILETKQVFLLDNDLISIGRVGDNTLVLYSPDVSRYHANLVWNPNGYAITDLGSLSGTRVNDNELPPHVPEPLIDGDVIHIGGYRLRFFSMGRTARPFPLQELEATIQFLPSESTVVSFAPTVPILHITTPQWTRDFPLEQDNLMLGRDPASDIVIDFSVVSGKHAQLRRCEGSYEIFDLGSKNGLTFEGHRISQKLLINGDVICIGSNIALAYQTTPFVAEPAPTKVQGLQDGTTLSSSQGWSNDTSTKYLDLRGRDILTLGRDSQNDTVIDHPTVSRYHAIISRQEGSFYIIDLKSSIGTFVNGKRVINKHPLRLGDTIRIGPCRLVLNVDETLLRHDEEGNLRLDAIHLRKVVGKGTTLLNDISLSILAKEFVVIAGVSGGGKSTLLDALNGFRPATSGSVLVNGIDLYKNFNAYRTELGYVPQKDIVHMELTVSQALNYAAQLRMPADTTRAERNARVQEVLEDLGLSHCRDVPVKDLSGGQLKRVSIGVELLTKPSLFFLDEATSGLDPGTEADIMRLLRKLADQGRTVILITHATENVILCDLVVFLAAGGRVAYLGPPDEAPQHFGVMKFNEIYPKVERERSPAEWLNRYQRSPQNQKYVVDRQHKVEASHVDTQRNRLKQQSPGSRVKQISAWQQFLILSQRNLAILMRDRASLTLMLAIAPILGVLDFFIWPRRVFDVQEGDTQQALMMLFVTGIIAIMVGSLSSMREIVKESEIYRRERMVGLLIPPYILSKIWLGVLVSLYQAAVFVLFKELAVNIPGGFKVATGLYVTLVLATLAGMMLGLLVSALAPNQNVAPLLIILILIPQITFGGGLLPANALGPPGLLISQVTPSKWAFGTMVTITDLGQDVAEDKCLANLSKQQLDSLTEAEKAKRCKCLGPQVFKQCQFPGIEAKYEEAVDTKEPQRPEKPTPPTRPERPKEQSLEAQRRYQEDLDKFEDDFQTFEDKLEKFEKDIDNWQDKYSMWKQKRESAIGEAEGIIRKYHQDYGTTFNVNVVKYWGILGLIMTVVFALLLLVQKRKDVV